MRGYRFWLDRGLTLVTVLALVTAVYFLVKERLIPAVRSEPARVIEGEELAESFQFELLSRDGSASRAARIQVPGRRPALLLVFDSACPACYANLPAWRDLLAVSAGGVISLAIGLDRDPRDAWKYAHDHLPAATAVSIRNAREFATVMGVRVVPFTALVGADGVLHFARQGRLDATATETAIRALEALTGSSNG